MGVSMLLVLTAALALAGDVDLSPAAVWAPRPRANDQAAVSLAVAWQPQRLGLALAVEQRAPPQREPIPQMIIDSEPVRMDSALSVVRQRAALVLDVVAVRGSIQAGRHELPLRVHLGAGPGLISTRDDLDALRLSSQPSALETAEQLHPTLDLTAALDLGLTKRTLIRMGAANTRYTETVNSDVRFGVSTLTWSLGPTLAL